VKRIVLMAINLLGEWMMNKLLILLIGIFMISSVYALGVTPARTTMDFEPGLSRQVGFEVINSGEQDMKIVLSAQGELAEYIPSTTREAEILSTEKSKSFTYDINLPADMEPGLHTADVHIMQLPSDYSGESQILATVAVVTQIYVYVPYPGKYANAKLFAYNANQGEDVKLVFSVISAGEFDLTSVRANVDIYNKLNEKIDSFNTKEIAVASGTKGEIVYNWKADVSIGEYRAAAVLIYDEGTINLEEIFTVGSKELELQEISVNGFSLGEIAKLEMLVENKWSEPISDAHIETKITNDEGDSVSSFESANYDIGALEKQVFVSYWDTAGVRAGTYDAEVSINYADKASKKNLQFQVEKNSLTVVGLGYVISNADDEGEGNGLVVVLIIAIVFLVLINLLWFLLLRKRLKK